MDDFEKNFREVCAELEKLNETFSIKGTPEENQEAWVQVQDNEVKLWQIPHTTGEVLKSFVMANKSKVILELGTSAGYSAIWLAAGARHVGGKVYTVELAQPKIEMAKKYFEKARLDSVIEQIEGKISEVLDVWDKEVDLVFIDADKEGYLPYLKQVESFLKKGSVIIADNAIDFAYRMQDYLDYVSTDPKYYSFLLKIDNGLMISIVV